MKRISVKILFALVIASFFVMPVVAQAAPRWWPLVPCGLNEPPPGETRLDSSYYQPCNECDLLRLLKNVIDFIYFGITPILATMFFVWAGLRIITAGGVPGELGKGTAMFRQTLIGILFLSLAWLMTNTLLKSFAKQDIAEHWWQLTCTPYQPSPVPSGAPVPSTCTDLASIARSNNVPFPAKNSPALDQLITCVKSDSSVSQLLDTSQIYSYENSNPACNYTRGQSTCGSCQHAVYSCHYGGRSGTQGSEGVDFNSKGSEQELYNRINALKSRCNFGYILFETDHTHVSTQACDGN